ncbi:MAG: hypothetical protein EA381_11045 [Planctomycetaceae bacterium]|nr:MAG: hypothetical protein EA381_11045 [Planctomycetaceae bacterium]
MVIGNSAHLRAKTVRRAASSVRRIGLASLLFVSASGPIPMLSIDRAAASDPVVAQSQPKPLHLNLKRFEIPFNIESTGRRPVQVQLHVSRDAGATWEVAATLPSTAKFFPFEAPEDGDYWFATRTLDGAGKVHPAGTIRPQLAICVDTTDPQVEWETEVDAEGGWIDVSLWYVDRSPIAEGIRIEYSVDGGRPWVPATDVETRLGKVGETSAVATVRIDPGKNWRQVTLRALVGDAAGNKTLVTRQVDRPRMAVATMRLAETKSSAQESSVPQSSTPPFLADPAPNALSEPDETKLAADAPYTPAVPPAADLDSANREPLVRIAQWPTVPLTGPLTGPSPSNSNGYPATPPTGPYTPNTPPPGMVPNPFYMPGNPLGNAVGNGIAAGNQPGPQFAAPIPSGQPPANQSPANQSPVGSPWATSGPWSNPAQSSTPGPWSPGVPSLNDDSPIALTPAQPAPRPQTPAEAMRPLEPGTSSDAAAGNPLPAPNPQSADSNRPADSDPRRQPSADPNSATRSRNGYGAPGNNSAFNPASAAINSDRARQDSPTDENTTRSMRPRNEPPADFGSIPVRHSASRMFSLEYEIESAGLSGISDVELWGTTDRGATWKRWGSDPDRTSPFDIETNHDGDYGFRIVVVSNTGLATPRPLDGEPADIVIVVDTQAPTVRITGAAYGQGNQTGHLIIRYKAEDAHLANRPITISFSESISGPWSTIAAGLANEGIYAWPADPHLPRQVYLRIDVADQAGNRNHYILDTPIDVQGLAPRARIRGFNPVTGSGGGSAASGVSPGGNTASPGGNGRATAPTGPRLE